jgi:biotin transport system substrate-specific component
MQLTKNFSVHSMTLCAMFAVLITLGAYIKIPVPVVPFTLQLLFTTLAGLLLGSRLGAISVILYTAMGLAGLPVFASGGGPGYILEPSFGYMIGFAAGSWITGRIVEKKQTFSMKRILLANYTGLAIVYLFGMVYYYFICNYVINTPIGFWPLFLYCFLLAVPGDIVLCFVAALITKKLFPIIKRRYTQ